MLSKSESKGITMKSILNKLSEAGLPTFMLQPKVFNNTHFVNLSGVAKSLSVMGCMYLLVPYLNFYPRRKRNGRIQIVKLTKYGHRLVSEWMVPQLHTKWCEIEKPDSNIWVRASFVLELLSHVSKTQIKDNATIELFKQFGFAELTTHQVYLEGDIRKISATTRLKTVNSETGTRVVLYDPKFVWLNDKSLLRTQSIKSPRAFTSIIVDPINSVQIIPRFPDRVL